MIASYFETKPDGKTGEYAQAYLTGLLSQVRRKNMEGFAEAVPNVPWQNLQQFLSDSPWEWGPLWGWLGREVSKDLGGGADNMLLLDESAFAKKGRKSVGVARQYSGRLGKVDNCQIGVFSCLSRGDRAALIGARLYLPEEWTEDSERSDEVGIPEADQGFKTKNQLARELIAEASANGVEFGWVAFDAGYGRDQDLLLEVAAQGKLFMADVDSDQLVWLERPSGEERPGNLRGAGARPVDGIRRLDPGRPREVALRQGENGEVRVEVQCRRVWIWPESSPKPLGVWLIVTRLANGKIKFSLSNAPGETSWEELARRQGQRFFIERCFEDAKSDLGMAEYQFRKWRAWHHHMVMVALAGLFVMRERADVGLNSPLTSVRDVVELIAWYFTGPRNQEDVVRIIHQRHARREKVRQSKLRNQRKRKRMNPL